MRLSLLLTIFVISLPVFADIGEAAAVEGQTSLSSMESEWGRNKDSFVRDNDHERIKQLVDNLLKSPSDSKNEEKSFPQADSTK
jgi:hypothetical protein